MIELKQIRRSFLLGLAGLGISQTLPQGQTAAQAAAPQGYVLGPDGGDHLVHFRNPGNIFIKVDPVKGSPNLALGTQPVPVGAGIPIHRHFEMDEAFYILEGGGTFMLDEQPHSIREGWNDKHSQERLARVRESRSRIATALDCSASGPERLFPGNLQSARRAARKQLTKDQINEIARKYATEFR